MDDNLYLKMICDGRWLFTECPSMEDNLLMEDNPSWKTTFHGRQPLMEDDHWWNRTFDGRQPLMEDDLGWKINMDGRWPQMEDVFWWKTIFDRRQPSIEDNLQCKTTSVVYNLIWKTRIFSSTKRLVVLYCLSDGVNWYSFNSSDRQMYLNLGPHLHYCYS